MARKMKDSGIEWIGDIPLDWLVAPLKYLLTEEADNIKVGPFGSQLSGNDFVDDGYWVYNQRAVMDNNFDYNDTCISKEKYNLMKSFQVRENDILITTRGTIGRICRIPLSYHRGIIHPCIIKFRVDENKILYSLLELIFNHSDIIKTQLSYKSNATTIDVIYGETLKNIILPLPPLNEQKRIADYLDKKCTEIDSLSSDIQSQIRILDDYKKSVITEAVTKGLNPDVEMKDSGFEWVGKIPEHWEKTPLKNISTKPISYGVIKLYEPDENGVKILRCSDVKDGYIVEDSIRTITKKLSNEYSRTILQSGDVVINVRGTLGGCAVIPESMTGYNIAREIALIAVDKKKYSNAYVMYCLLSKSFENFRDYSLSGCIYLGINMETLSKYVCPLPPLNEQKEIVNYLNEKCCEVNKLITKKKEQIDILEQYKKSLIYEYVTGKREVV